ncbi:MAG: MMPL family transporter [Deltaproteobacteria bacterium]|nr:MMPL family transporter [Deltaproteobacteria bacterium]
MKNRIATYFTWFVLKCWWLILLVATLGAISSFQTSQALKFKSDFLELLPDYFPSLKSLNAIKERAGGEGYFIVVLEGGELSQTKALADILAQKLSTFPEISYVDYQFDRNFFEPRSLLFIDLPDLEILKQRLAKKIHYERNRHNPFYIDLLEEKDSFQIDDLKEKYTKSLIRDYYVTENPERVVLLAKPKGLATNLSFSKTLLSKTQALIATLNPKSFDPNIKVKYTGRYVTQLEEAQFMNQDLRRTSLIAIIGVLLSIILYTRRWSSVLIIAIPLLLSILYTVAFATLTIGYLNVVSSILIGVLTGLGIDFGIHLYLRYLEERRHHLPLEEAVFKIFKACGKPVFMAAVTTAIAFLVLTPSQFLGFSHFGWISGMGILICLITTYLVLPSLLVAQEKIIPYRPKLALVLAQPDFWIHHQKYPKPLVTLCASIGIMALGLWGVFQIQFDYDFRKLSADSFGTLALQEEISSYFGVSLSPAVVYVQDPKKLPQLHKTLDTLRKKTPNSTIKNGMSLYSYVPEHQPEKLKIIADIRKLSNDKAFKFLDTDESQELQNLKKWTSVESFGLNDLPPLLRQQYNPINGYEGSFLFIFPGVDLWQGKEVVRFADEIRQFQKEAKNQNIIVASEAVIFSDILMLIQREGPLALLASLMALLVLLFMDLKRFSSVALVMSPLIAGFLSLIAFLYVFNIKLNFMNCVIFVILIGMGIDSGLHIFHRYQEMGPRSLRFVIRHTGGAVFLSSLTTMIGFGALFFANHRGIESFGLLSFIGIFLTFITAVTFLPAVLQLMENRMLRKKSTQQRLNSKTDVQKERDLQFHTINE